MAVGEAEKNMVFAARLTQRGHRIRGMDDLMELYEKAFTDDTVEAISSLPHPAVQKFAVINSSCHRSKPAFSGTDHETPERGAVYECVAAIQ